MTSSPMTEPVEIESEHTPLGPDEFSVIDKRIRSNVKRLGALWIAIAQDLLEVRTRGGYQYAGYKTFEAYLKSVREMSPAYARRLMTSAEMVSEALGGPETARPTGRPRALTQEDLDRANAGTGFATPRLQAPPEHLPSERSIRTLRATVGREEGVERLRAHLADPEVPLMPAPAPEVVIIEPEEPPKPLSEKEIVTMARGAEARVLFDHGWTVDRMSRKYNVSPSTVQAYLEQQTVVTGSRPKPRLSLIRAVLPEDLDDLVEALRGRYNSEQLADLASRLSD